MGFQAQGPAVQFAERQLWIAPLGAHYHVGLDGLNLLLVLLTTFLTLLAVLSSWTSVSKHLKGYLIAMLLLETGMIGVFVSLDLLLFYVFWEATLIPMYLLIGVWGRRAAHLRGGQVLPLHHGRQRADDGGHPGPLLPERGRHGHSDL
jgi:NADH-quinone oxidoreductase subunit M